MGYIRVYFFCDIHFLWVKGIRKFLHSCQPPHDKHLKGVDRLLYGECGLISVVTLSCIATKKTYVKFPHAKKRLSQSGNFDTPRASCNHSYASFALLACMIWPRIRVHVPRRVHCHAEPIFALNLMSGGQEHGDIHQFVIYVVAIATGGVGRDTVNPDMTKV